MPPCDLICLSHLRWHFVFQRPQHILTRLAANRRVFFVEEPVFDGEYPSLDEHISDGGVHVLTPHLKSGLQQTDAEQATRYLLNEYASEHAIERPIVWYYTPMAIPVAKDIVPAAVVYDCMDELSAFAGAPTLLREREAELFRQADLVFTGGRSLYEAKKAAHARVYLFPSSVDVAHFARARQTAADPSDQAGIPHPRLGFFGVVDERFDRELLAEAASARPDWHYVIIGPVVKIDPATLPQAPNIHYLGSKPYAELPEYISGWDVALLLFARNEATRFISPTKTPEYLAAGRPVVSTSIRDVVSPYGEQRLVRIADTPADLVAAAEAAMAEDEQGRRAAADAFLADMSWDKIAAEMADLIDDVVCEREQRSRKPDVPTA